jgi:hypothetical protein
MAVSFLSIAPPLYYTRAACTGLFGDLKYLTSSETSVHTQAEAAGVESRGLKTREKAIVSSNIQSSYDTWCVVRL